MISAPVISTSSQVTSTHHLFERGITQTGTPLEVGALGKEAMISKLFCASFPHPVRPRLLDSL